MDRYLGGKVGGAEDGLEVFIEDADRREWPKLGFVGDGNAVKGGGVHACTHLFE